MQEKGDAAICNRFGDAGRGPEGGFSGRVSAAGIMPSRALSNRRRNQRA